MPRSENSRIAGIVVVDSQFKPIAAVGLGNDAGFVRSLLTSNG